MRLAFEFDRAEAGRADGGLTVPIEYSDRMTMARHLFEQVLIYRGSDRGELTFFGQTDLVGVGDEDRGLVVRLSQPKFWDHEIARAPFNIESRRRWQMLDERLDRAIVSEVEDRSVRDPDSGGFAETGQAAFASEDTLVTDTKLFPKLAAAVCRNYGYRCAVTGIPGTDRFGAPDELFVLMIVPSDHGGPHHVRNCMPLHRRVADAFKVHEFTIAPDLSLLVNEARLDRWIGAHLTEEAKLNVPADASLQPDQHFLAWHRDEFMCALEMA